MRAGRATGEDEGPAALLVDYAGVLSRPLEVSHRAWCEEEGIEPESLESLLGRWTATAPNPVHEVERGAMSTTDFEHRLAAELSVRSGKSISARGLVARMLASFAPDETMVEVVRRAHAGGVRTALVTNCWSAEAPWGKYADSFDALVLSRRVGCRKPERRIYALAAQRLGVTPERCVFVDDAVRNVKGAATAGMISVHHRDAASTREALVDYFGGRL